MSEKVLSNCSVLLSKMFSVDNADYLIQTHKTKFHTNSNGTSKPSSKEITRMANLKNREEGSQRID